MSNVPQIRAVYSALREMLGANASSTELLRFASELLRFCDRRRAAAAGFYLRDPYEAGGLPFELWPVDVAMRDGGWMVMEYELDQFEDQLVGRASIYGFDANLAQQRYLAQCTAPAWGSDELIRPLGWLSENKKNATEFAAFPDDVDLGEDDYHMEDWASE